MTRIIIADPDPASRKALSLLLTRKLGAEVIIEVTEADSLPGLVKSTQPDALLLDDGLPGLSLPGTCVQLQGEFPRLKIIMLSLDETAHEKAIPCAIEFIHKGACLDETLFLLQTILGETK